MLSQMRANMKVIMMILVVAFMATIIFSWGMDYRGPSGGASAGVIGQINEREISYDFFFRALQNEYMRIRELTGSEPDESRMSQARDQLWQQLVDETLISEEVERRGIAITDDEVVFIIKNDPPEFLRSDPTFQTNGVFDPQKYQELLTNPEVNWSSVENAVRSVYPQNKLRNMILSTVRITDDEIRQEFLQQQETVTIRYIQSGPSQFQDEAVTVADNEVDAYYQEHTDQFMDPPTATLRYVLFDNTMTAADTQAVNKQVNELLERARNDEDFAELAAMYSKDPSAETNNGSLGMFGRGQMIPEFENAAFDAKPDDIVGPIETQFGLHIIKVHDQVKSSRGVVDSVNASHILLRMEMPEDRADDLRYDARFFADAANEKGLTLAAEEESQEIIESTPIREGGFIAGLGQVPDISNFAFRNEVNTTSNAIETNRGWVVLEITEKTEERQIAQDEVAATIKNILETEKRKEFAKRDLEAAKSEIQSGETLADLDEKSDRTSVTSQPFRINDFIPMIGREPALSGAAFKLQPGEIAGPVETAQDYYLIELVERTTPDSVDQRIQSPELRQQLLQRKQQLTYASWMQELRDKADIKDFRNQYWK
jgi:peptidyl-prolyl cis-trans isomerase D